MATRGAKPKPTHLHLVQGTINATRHKDALASPNAAGALVKPTYIRAGTRAAALWDEVAAACWWLGDADSYKLGMWCAMQAEFERGPSKMTSARIGQLRALGSELGLDPASRSRLGAMKGNRGGSQGEAPDQPKSKDSYFT